MQKSVEGHRFDEMRYSNGERAQLLLIRPMRHTQRISIHYRNDARTHYEVLGVRRDASLKEIKNAFYTLSKKYHPDVAGSSISSASTTNFMVIKDAYDVLRDPEKRRAYDQQISIQNAFNFESPFHEGPFTSPFNVRHRTRAQPPRQSYTEAEYQRMFDQFRRRYDSEAYQAFQEEMRQRAWDEQLRRRAEFLRRQSARYSSRRGFSRQRTDGAYSSRFDFTNDFAYNFELLNKILAIYLVVFFAVAITSGVYQRMGDFRFVSESTAAQENKEEERKRIDDMVMHPPVRRPSGD